MDELLAEALQLPEAERRELATALLRSLEDDGMSEAERAELHESLRRGIEQMEAGQFVDADKVITRLLGRPRSKRPREGPCRCPGCAAFDGSNVDPLHEMDEEDEFDEEEERAEFVASLEESIRDMEAGRGIPLDEAMAWLRASTPDESGPVESAPVTGALPVAPRPPRIDAAPEVSPQTDRTSLWNACP